ncbi:hypothetical protein BAS06_02945 [Elizabethkingia miricola]|uniref:hypothetical protein n=1 Tax=Elizabethkingia miricola TaxID=172045 RepID=UPI00099A654D|nr:hypothetical protein [Elizabethkingia miricola]OPB92185.1 hypothetical protein BAS06_02945 [Elizabethkingia miricola]
MRLNNFFPFYIVIISIIINGCRTDSNYEKTESNNDLFKKEQIIQKLKDKYPDIDINFNEDKLTMSNIKELENFENEINKFYKLTESFEQKNLVASLSESEMNSLTIKKAGYKRIFHSQEVTMNGGFINDDLVSTINYRFTIPTANPLSKIFITGTVNTPNLKKKDFNDFYSKQLFKKYNGTFSANVEGLNLGLSIDYIGAQTASSRPGINPDIIAEALDLTFLGRMGFPKVGAELTRKMTLKVDLIHAIKDNYTMYLSTWKQAVD